MAKTVDVVVPTVGESVSEIVEVRIMKMLAILFPKERK